LHVATARQNPEVIELLLRAGTPVAATDDEGNTPLHLSAEAWQTNSLALLLGAHALLDATNRAGRTALRIAVESGSSQNVELLLKAGANPATGLAGETLAHIAAERSGGGDTLKVLIQHGLAVNARDNKGRTPFGRAAKARQWDAVKFLLAKHANINVADAQGNTALHLLSEEQDDTVNHPAELSFLDGWKQSALARGGWTANGLSKLIQWKMVSPPPGFFWTNTSLVDWLLQHGAKPGATNYLGQTPLHVLCGQQWLSFFPGTRTNRVAQLLKAGATVQAKDISGVTCLHIAATNVAPEVLLVLQSHLALKSGSGKGVCTDNKGRTPLHYVVSDRNMNRDELLGREAALLAGGADPNTPDQKGRTPLHEVMLRPDNTDYFQSPMVTMLLSNKANPNLQDKDGATPLHLAMKAWQANPANAYWVFDTACLLLTNHS
jgi:ankyrin repeat protein